MYSYKNRYFAVFFDIRGAAIGIKNKNNFVFVKQDQKKVGSNR